MYITALPCHLRAVFTMQFVYKGHTHQLIDSPWLQLPYKWKGNTYNLFNQSQISISHHITPLVINSLGGGHTHTQTYSHCRQKQFKETSHVQAEGQRTPGLKNRSNIYDITVKNNILDIWRELVYKISNSLA